MTRGFGLAEPRRAVGPRSACSEPHLHPKQTTLRFGALRRTRLTNSFIGIKELKPEPIRRNVSVSLCHGRRLRNPSFLAISNGPGSIARERRPFPKLGKPLLRFKKTKKPSGPVVQNRPG